MLYFQMHSLDDAFRKILNNLIFISNLANYLFDIKETKLNKTK